MGELRGVVYYLQRVATKTLAHMTTTCDIFWHQRFGHPSRHIRVQGINLYLGKYLNKDCDMKNKKERQNGMKEITFS